MNRYSILATGAFALVACVPALAADHAVSVGGGGLVFTPNNPTIIAGDTVTFTNAGGFHNVVSDPGSVTTFRCANGCDGDGSGGNGNASSAAWTATVTFPTAGSAPFHCQIHEGSGMVGTITVMPATTGAPTIGTDQTSLSATAEIGATASTTFAIMNSGTADLTWTADTASTDCATPDSVPWIALDPAAGTVATGAPATTVNVTLDASGLDIGVHSANVCIHNNDPAHDPLALPVQFTVTTPDLIFKDGFDG
ncbi:MAG TPA: plastocyanin/azurin family copper-binding protein [Dokdonella sp.]